MNGVQREAFADELIKLALGPRLLSAGLRLAEQRGARVAPQILSSLEQQAAKGVSRVSGDARGLVSSARESLRGPTISSIAGGVPTSTAMPKQIMDAQSHALNRVQRADAMPYHVAHDLRKPLEAAEQLHAYSPEYTKTIMGTRAPVRDPHGLMQNTGRAPAGGHPTAPMGASRVAPGGAVDPHAATQVGGYAGATEPTGLIRTQVGQVGGRHLSDPGNPLGREAVTLDRSRAAAGAAMADPYAGGYASAQHSALGGGSAAPPTAGTMVRRPQRALAA